MGNQSFLAPLSARYKRNAVHGPALPGCPKKISPCVHPGRLRRLWQTYVGQIAMHPSGNVSWPGWRRTSEKNLQEQPCPWDIGELLNVICQVSLRRMWVKFKIWRRVKQLKSTSLMCLFCGEEGWHQCQNNPCELFHRFSHFAPPRPFKSPSPSHVYIRSKKHCR